MKKNQSNHPLQNHFSAVSDAELATGWFKRLIQKADYDEATRVAKLLRSQNKSLVAASRLHKIELDIWDAMLRTRTASDQDFNFAQRLLNDSIKKLEKMPPGTKRNIVLGRAYNNLGYLLRVQGKFYGACTAYRKALPIWRELRLDEEQATTLNNLAFALAEVGVFNVAQNMAIDARGLRQKLNNFSIVPLNLNTLAHIAVRENKPELALKYVGEALRRSRQIPNLRARGLTLIVGSEAHRRRLRSRDFETLNNLADLNIALDYAEKACAIFSNKIKEPERHVEALIELGCTYRDFTKYLRNGFKVTPESKAYGKKSEKALREAARIAKREKITYRAVDALVNLAWLKYYLRQNVDDILDEAFAEVPKAYKEVHKKKASVKDMENYVVPYLIQLGKAHTLKGQMNFSLFNDKKRLKEEREKSLESAIQYHALALQYNTMVGDAVIMQLRNTHERIYENIRRLNPGETQIVLKALERFEKEQGIHGQCEMRKFLVWHGLIDG